MVFTKGTNYEEFAQPRVYKTSMNKTVNQEKEKRQKGLSEKDIHINFSSNLICKITTTLIVFKYLRKLVNLQIKVKKRYYYDIARAIDTQINGIEQRTQRRFLIYNRVDTTN